MGASISVIININLRKFIHYPFYDSTPFPSDFWIYPLRYPHVVFTCGFILVTLTSTRSVARGDVVHWIHTLSVDTTVTPLITNVLAVCLLIGGTHQIFLRCGGACACPCPYLSRYNHFQLFLYFSKLSGEIF